MHMNKRTHAAIDARQVTIFVLVVLLTTGRNDSIFSLDRVSAEVNSFHSCSRTDRNSRSEASSIHFAKSSNSVDEILPVLYFLSLVFIGSTYIIHNLRFYNMKNQIIFTSCSLIFFNADESWFLTTCSWIERYLAISSIDISFSRLSCHIYLCLGVKDFFAISRALTYTS